MSKVTTVWQRSSFCAAGQCVEVANVDGTVLLRDSKNPGQPALAFTPAEWSDFQALVQGAANSADA